MMQRYDYFLIYKNFLLKNDNFLLFSTFCERCRGLGNNAETEMVSVHLGLTIVVIFIDYSKHRR